MRHALRLVPLVALVVAGCAKPLAAPVAAASATSNQVAVGSVVTLDGSKSRDPNATPQPIFYHWNFKALPAGSRATLNDASLVNPSFTADVAGDYVVTLVVSSLKLSSAPVEVKVTAGPCGTNRPVVGAIAATPDNPGSGQAVLLSATVTDADNDASCGLSKTLSYAWQILSLPAGSHASLNLADAQTPSFVTDVPGDYAVQLVVTDSAGLKSDPATLTVTAKTCGSAAPSVDAPAATPAAPGIGQLVVLAASATDADDDESCAAGQTLSYRWFFVSLPAGSLAHLNDATVLSPSFVPDVAGDYVLRVEVTDSTGLTTLSSPLTVSASSCGGAAPTVQSIAANPAAPNSGDVVQLSATLHDADADDPCDEPQSFRYAWRLTGLPAGSEAHLNDAGAANPSFTADVPGSYAAELVVTDQSGLASVATSFSVDVATCGSAAPVASVVVPEGAAIGQAVALSATVSDSNSDCRSAPESFRYRWSFASVPTGSLATLNDAGVEAPSFVPDVAGDYAVQLVVTDAEGHESAPAVGTVTVSACGGNAPQASASASTTSPALGQVVQLTSTVTDADDQDPCGGAQTFSYRWSFSQLPAGSTATLNDASLAAPSFTVDLPGEYDLALVVTDSTGRASSAATVQLTASTCGGNAPVAAASASTQAPNLGEAVLLTASATDADDQDPCDQASGFVAQTFSWRWSFDALPAGSHASLNATAATSPSFVPDVPGDYVVRLVAIDSAGLASAPATLTVTATSCGGAAPEATATASTTSPAIGEAVLLTGSAADEDNADPCDAGQTFSYAWNFDALPAGSHASLNSASAAKPSFVPDVAGDYVARLVVTDSTGAKSAPATVKITASTCGANAPVASIDASDVKPATGEPVLLTASATDADDDAACGSMGQTFTFAWSLVALPAGSRASLNATGATEPSFVPDVPGDYTVQLVATDSTGRQSAAATQVVTADACGTNAPSATVSVSPASVGVGMAVKLAPTVTDADDGATCQGLDTPPPMQTFSFAWTLLSAPVGSAAALVSASARDAAFTADVAGSYTVRLVVTDSSGRQSAPIETVVTADPCGSNAPAVTTVAASLPTPNIGDALALTATVDDADNGGACQAILGALQGESYRWSVTAAPAGSSAAVLHPASTTASFVPDVAGDYTLSFTITDATGRSASKSLGFTAGLCGSNPPAVSPTVEVGSTARVGGTVTIDAGQSDADVASCGLSQTVGYAWTFLDVPAASAPKTGATTADRFSFSPDVAGTYVVEVTPTDSTGLTGAPGTATVVVSACGGAAPVAHVTGPTTISAGQIAQFDALGLANPSVDPDDAAPCGLSQTLTFDWELFSVPSGSRANLNPQPTVSNPWFQADKAGTYVVRLKVMDSTGLTSDWAQVTLTAN